MLEISKALDAEENLKYKEFLDRIVAMLTRLGGRSYRAEEEGEEYRTDGDTDSDSDSD